jgi:beta-xylosidase
MSKRPLPLIATLLLGGAIALTGCSSSGSSGSTTTTSTTAKAAATTTTTSPVPIENNAAIRTQAVITSCTAAPGGWQASGTATNPGKASYDYKLTVYFTSAQATVLGSGQTSVTVGAKSTGKWKVTATFPAPAGVKCVLVGVK